MRCRIASRNRCGPSWWDGGIKGAPCSSVSVSSAIASSASGTRSQGTRLRTCWKRSTLGCGLGSRRIIGLSIGSRFDLRCRHWPDHEGLPSAFAQFKRAGEGVVCVPSSAEIISIDADGASVCVLVWKVRNLRLAQQLGRYEFACLLGGPGFVEGHLEGDAARLLGEADGRVKV